MIDHKNQNRVQSNCLEKACKWQLEDKENVPIVHETNFYVKRVDQYTVKMIYTPTPSRNLQTQMFSAYDETPVRKRNKCLPKFD